MKTIIKLSSTIISVLMIVAGLVSLFTIDNAQNLISLMIYAIVMIMGISGGIYLLTLAYPELTDLSEFDDKSLNSLEECQQELEELREHNLLLIDRYITFKSILRSSNAIDESNKEKYANLYRLIYEEDLVCGKN